MKHRSRLGWADPMDEEPPDAPAHTHRLPRVVRLAIVGLTAAVFLIAIALGLVAVYVYQANQYVEGRGEYRDQETSRLEERIRQSICDLLDQLPEGGLLERPRAKYGCGPGIPVELLTPEERERIGRSSPTPAAPTSTAPPPLGSAAVPDPPQPTFGTPGPTRTPEPTAQPSSVTEFVCDALGVCVDLP